MDNKEYLRAKNKDFIDSILANVGKKEEIIKAEPLFKNVDDAKVQETVKNIIAGEEKKKK